ncbi:hypothetical protein A6046_02435 [[Haemophilus] ducreyi]|uniref:Endolytic peptidoglycan transglycosylase RlpA n=2 Tax=Haemophilus ducreyi TaxID=730 RepID=Q7VKA6_HAEDU|nr:septal ring lytic transglycosylase RlpA family protein [[Haemophilus] ducreyi]AAP96726.1 putative rare lipoprotein A [[Haemophilus] ducreyi 35000HP]AKO31549.1 lipoprotein [[Haemophilus] ducreyi]AKO33006.1 lipoprotein [[Haemophilus] ducreyi]AKO34452.1 lipoprotein [[Haemophilus] ducreyi]AKO35896.1 lipoprotein [[Haemophilus] ducreyi]
MRLRKMVTLLLAGFLTFGSLNSVATTKDLKNTEVKKLTASEIDKKELLKVKRTMALKTANNKSLKEQYKNSLRSHYQSGIASYYGDQFNGRLTANGELFSNNEMTAAHKTLPFGTLLEVTNVRNGRSVIVRVNDRGPYYGSRIVDLSKAAAIELGMKRAGLAKVKLAVLNKNKKGNNTYVNEDI